MWQNTHMQLQCIYPFPPVRPVKNPKFTVSCEKLCLNLKPNWSTFYFERYTYHIRVYFMWLILFCNFVWGLIYFCRSVRASFWLVCVTLNYLLELPRFWTICDSVILRRTSESHIWLSIVTFRTFIFGVAWIVRWT